MDNKKKIRDYMFKWIKDGARVLMFTRDLSWVNDKEMKNMLARKARQGELNILLPEETELTKDLGSQKASVFSYGRVDDVPQSRFTIVSFGSAGSRVAVGRRHGRFHVIEEFSANDHPAFYLAHDLVHALMRAARSRGGAA